MLDITGDNRLEPELARINARQHTGKDERAAKHHEPRTDLENVSDQVSVSDSDGGCDDEDKDEVAGGSVVFVLHESVASGGVVNAMRTFAHDCLSTLLPANKTWEVELYHADGGL